MVRSARNTSRNAYGAKVQCAHVALKTCVMLEKCACGAKAYACGAGTYACCAKSHPLV